LVLAKLFKVSSAAQNRYAVITGTGYYSFGPSTPGLLGPDYFPESLIGEQALDLSVPQGFLAPTIIACSFCFLTSPNQALSNWTYTSRLARSTGGPCWLFIAIFPSISVESCYHLLQRWAPGKQSAIPEFEYRSGIWTADGLVGATLWTWTLQPSCFGVVRRSFVEGLTFVTRP
jgi:hypothetical protein